MLSHQQWYIGKADEEVVETDDIHCEREELSNHDYDQWVESYQEEDLDGCWHIALTQ